MTRPTTAARTCDALGVCQGHATPCKGCGNGHPTYHHLHRVVSLESAGQCSRGCDMCPSPQACELAEKDNAPIYTPLRAAAALAGSALIVLACVAAAIFWIKTGLSA